MLLSFTRNRSAGIRSVHQSSCCRCKCAQCASFHLCPVAHACNCQYSQPVQPWPQWLPMSTLFPVAAGCFENTVVALYNYVVPKPKDECSKTEQLGVSFAAGYIAGVFCAVISHPADNLVSGAALLAHQGLSMWLGPSQPILQKLLAIAGNGIMASVTDLCKVCHSSLQSAVQRLHQHQHPTNWKKATTQAVC